VAIRKNKEEGIWIGKVTKVKKSSFSIQWFEEKSTDTGDYYLSKNFTNSVKSTQVLAKVRNWAGGHFPDNKMEQLKKIK
jgi:hypothetical protein